MSKQMTPELWMPPACWITLVKSLYLQMLRDAANIVGMGIRSSPPRKKAKSEHPTMFRASTSALAAASSTPPPSDAAEFDSVTDEIARFKVLPDERVNRFRNEAGIVNEFALFYDLKDSFPLHYTVFRQVSAHLPHEANTESIFSIAGKLSSENGCQDVNFLSDLVYMIANKKICKPEVLPIKKEYLTDFSKNGTLVESLLGPQGFDGLEEETDETEQQVCAYGTQLFFDETYLEWHHQSQHQSQLPLVMTPQSPLFSRTPTPTSPCSPCLSYSSR